MKIIILGHARHGKDTVGEYLSKYYGFSFISSSLAFAPQMMAFMPGQYQTVNECWEDRVNHREEWNRAIIEFNTPDASRLGKLIFERYDIYAGIRPKRELDALYLSMIPDVSIWVDAHLRLPLEPCMEVTESDTNFTLDNNGNLQTLYQRIDYLMSELGQNKNVVV